MRSGCTGPDPGPRPKPSPDADPSDASPKPAPIRHPRREAARRGLLYQERHEPGRAGLAGGRASVRARFTVGLALVQPSAPRPHLQAAHAHVAVQNLLAGASAAEAAKGINKGDDDGNSALHWAARKASAA